MYKREKYAKSVRVNRSVMTLPPTLVQRYHQPGDLQHVTTATPVTMATEDPSLPPPTLESPSYDLRGILGVKNQLSINRPTLVCLYHHPGDLHHVTTATPVLLWQLMAPVSFRPPDSIVPKSTECYRTLISSFAPPRFVHHYDWSGDLQPLLLQL